MQHWAAHELSAAHLGDTRLNRRLWALVEALAAQPATSVPLACRSWAATKAAYRFWDNPRVTPEAIRKAHGRATRERLRSHPTVLVIQDTTALDFTAHPHTRGLGPLASSHRQGLLVHSALAVSIGGVPLGLIHQAVWVRDAGAIGQRHRRRQRPTAEKESQRWLTATTACQSAIPEAIRAVIVADREADVYDLFAKERRAGLELLIRACRDRRVQQEAGCLWSVMARSPAGGELTVTVGRRGDLPDRDAVLTLRWCSLTILPPRHHLQRRQLAPIPLEGVLAQEESPPEGVCPVSWLLLTTLPVGSLSQAKQCVEWYSQRWLIERYHYVLKSGCRLEELQLETAQRLERALATYCLVAWRLLWLTYEAREHPTLPCDTALEPEEWQALYATIHQSLQLPAAPPSLREAIRWIAQLGGFLARRGDGEPGVQTLWRGLRRLHDITATWQLLHPPLPRPPPVGNA
jgi:hypothetical protein